MPPDEVAEAQRLHDLADEVDRFLVLEGVNHLTAAQKMQLVE